MKIAAASQRKRQRKKSLSRFVDNRKHRLGFTNPTFFVFKIRIPLEAMCCKNFGRFHRRKFKKITNKAKHSEKHICLGIYNSRRKPKILTEVIAKHYLIIRYYMQ